MDSRYIIKKPLLTEKSTFHSDESNRYSFEVPVTARKDQIKAAIEDLYKVRVLKVNTVTRRSRNRRMKYGLVTGSVTKKAIVRVHPEDTIELI
ncbi:MAG TPA: 50S ribosomal protein L23 [Phycisphaerales bacterium]|nr:50S ribosomal protein L23 [Phycisphaerales bacterium]